LRGRFPDDRVVAGLRCNACGRIDGRGADPRRGQSDHPADDQRVEFLERHLVEIKAAIRALTPREAEAPEAALW
jgi:hypothetical protein